jgi:hypothetical protein
MEAQASETEYKVSITVSNHTYAAFLDLRVSAGLETAYLIAYGVHRLRKARRKATP